MKHYNHFGEILKEWRLANNMSQKDIANDFYSISTISRIEKYGKIQLDENFIIHLSKTFNVPIDYISRLIIDPNHFIVADIENNICNLIRTTDFKGAKYKLDKYINNRSSDNLKEILDLINFGNKFDLREFESSIYNNLYISKPMTKYKYFIFYVLYRHYLEIDKDLKYLRAFFKVYCSKDSNIDSDLQIHRHFIEYLLFRNCDKHKILQELQNSRHYFQYGIVLCINYEFDEAINLFKSIDHKLGLNEALYLKEKLSN